MTSARTDQPPAPSLFSPLLSVAVFGYYGFLAGLTTSDANGPVPIWIAFLWAMRVACVASLASVALVLSRSPRALAASAAIDFLNSLALVGLGVWDLLDPDHTVAVHPILLILIGCWFGYEAFAVLRSRRR
jgi:hypothetical protein